jgi:glutamate dehydrogenase
LAIETELRELITRNIPPELAPRAAIFAARTFAGDSGDSHQRIPSERWLALVQSGLEFFSARAEPVIARVSPGIADDTITIVETVTTDRPFIVDSLLEYFHHLGATVRTMLHPVLRVARDADGHVTSFEQSVAAERGESSTRARSSVTSFPF